MGNEQGRIVTSEQEALKKKAIVASMDWEMKQKLGSTGVKYNMRIVIKGDKCTGKTCLWKRLQNLDFVEEHVPTSEIQVSTINWNYKATDDIVKVEVWDVVDKAKKRGSFKLRDSLKLDHDETEEEVPPEKITEMEKKERGNFQLQKLDATIVNVYGKSTNAVILTFDPVKKWTWEYIQKEIKDIPDHLDILILANYRDMGEYRNVTESEARGWIEKQSRKNIRYLEASLKNDFGLKGVISFLNIPFLKLQRRYIEEQLELNLQELHQVEEEVDLITKEQNYDFYLKWLEQTQRNKSKGKKRGGSISQPQLSAPPSLPSLQRTSSFSASSSVPTSPEKQEHEEPKVTQSEAKPSIVDQTVSSPKKSVSQTSESGNKKGILSVFGFKKSSSGNKEETTKKVETHLKTLAEKKKRPTESIDDFKIGELDDNFFAEDEDSNRLGGIAENDDEESDEDEPNPLIAQDEDVSENEDFFYKDDDEPLPVQQTEKKKQIELQMELSEDEEEKETLGNTNIDQEENQSHLEAEEIIENKKEIESFPENEEENTPELEQKVDIEEDTELPEPEKEQSDKDNEEIETEDNSKVMIQQDEDPFWSEEETGETIKNETTKEETDELGNIEQSFEVLEREPIPEDSFSSTFSSPIILKDEDPFGEDEDDSAKVKKKKKKDDEISEKKKKPKSKKGKKKKKAEMEPEIPREEYDPL